LLASWESIARYVTSHLLPELIVICPCLVDSLLV
jgi:hypothetical protein